MKREENEENLKGFLQSTVCSCMKETKTKKKGKKRKKKRKTQLPFFVWLSFLWLVFDPVVAKEAPKAISHSEHKLEDFGNHHEL